MDNKQHPPPPHNIIYQLYLPPSEHYGLFPCIYIFHHTAASNIFSKYHFTFFPYNTFRSYKTVISQYHSVYAFLLTYSNTLIIQAGN